MADYARNFQPVFPSVFDAAVGDIERLPPGNAQDFRRLCRLACSIFCRAPRAHLALSEVENAGPVSAVGHLEQGSRHMSAQRHRGARQWRGYRANWMTLTFLENPEWQMISASDQATI